MPKDLSQQQSPSRGILDQIQVFQMVFITEVNKGLRQSNRRISPHFQVSITVIQSVIALNFTILEIITPSTSRCVGPLNGLKNLAGNFQCTCSDPIVDLQPVLKSFLVDPNTFPP